MENKTPNTNKETPSFKDLIKSLLLSVVTFFCVMMLFTVLTEPASITNKDITYTKYTADSLINDYVSESHTKKKYRGQYIQVKGTFEDLYASDTAIKVGPLEESAHKFYYLYCYCTKEEQQEIIDDMNTDDIITIKGKIIDVSEYCYTIEMHDVKITTKAETTSPPESSSSPATSDVGNMLHLYGTTLKH